MEKENCCKVHFCPITWVNFQEDISIITMTSWIHKFVLFMNSKIINSADNIFVTENQLTWDVIIVDFVKMGHSNLLDNNAKVLLLSNPINYYVLNTLSFYPFFRTHVQDLLCSFIRKGQKEVKICQGLSKKRDWEGNIVLA